MAYLSSLSLALARSLSEGDLFDAVLDTVYFVKDAEGRYAVVNQTLVERTGSGSKANLIGRTADDVFPGDLGQRIAEQDRVITKSGRMLTAELERHLYANGGEGWCLTWKVPLRDDAGRIVGLLGISRDVRPANEDPKETRALSEALAHARANVDKPLRIGDLAARTGLSIFRFDQKIRQLFGMSAGQYIARLRIDRACDLLRHSAWPISEIAIECGYADQTTFSRQFRKIVRLSPHRYRTFVQQGRNQDP
ncbi:MAG: soxS 1 [Proteobacteria bacterium]|nr:soxS 1 [Pseudomonadota bacterium]